MFVRSCQVGESIKGEIVPGTSRVMRAEDMVEMEGSAIPNIYLHPCHYFRLARLAFLKCLGLDPTAENSSSPQRGNRKESWHEFLLPLKREKLRPIYFVRRKDMYINLWTWSKTHQQVLVDLNLSITCESCGYSWANSGLESM